MSEYERWLRLADKREICEELTAIDGNAKEIDDRF